jgi:L-amino acid N-acyltransferase YncA
VLTIIRGVHVLESSTPAVREMPLCGVKFKELHVDEGLVVIRGACRDDRDRLIKFYESLDSETVYERFYHVVKDFSSYVDSLVEGGALVVVAELNGVIIGVAEAMACREDYAEVGVVLTREFRGRGLGTALCSSLGSACRVAGIKGLVAYARRYNVPVLNIARRLGATIKKGPEPDLVTIEVCLEG